MSKINKQVETIEDMQRFVESFPAFRQHSGNVSKHVALMSEDSVAPFHLLAWRS
jgi:vacuolar protein sorting-associated protein 45